MPIDEKKIRDLLERVQPSVKLKRLEEDLDGNPEKDIVGYREQLLRQFRAYESQQELVARRAGQRETVNPLALDKFDRGQAEAELNLQMLEMQIELYQDEIESTEKQIEEIKASGLDKPRGRGARRNEQLGRVPTE